MGHHQIIGGGKITIDLVAAPAAQSINLGTIPASFSFSGVNFGAAAPRRIIAIAVAGPITSATIDGVAATLIPLSFGALIYALVPSGTSGTVFVNVGGGAGSTARMFIAVYRINRAGVIAPSVQTPSLVSGTTPAAFSINVRNGGVALAIVVGSANFTSVWSGDFIESVDETDTFTIAPVTTRTTLTTAILQATAAKTPATGAETPSVSASRGIAAFAWK